ncbi:MAG TPA: hypothetical protein VKB80_25295 [Kofleriaceae bacterium]|nr:hypothetical protein [Kofleriaceae bacterium]
MTKTKRLFSIPATLSLLLWGTAGCALDAVDEGEQADQAEVIGNEAAPLGAGPETPVQTLGASCTLLRPFAWSSPGVSCMENPSHNTPIVIPDGGSYTAHAAHVFQWSGSGYAIIECHDGKIVVVEQVCQSGGGQEP